MGSLREYKRLNTRQASAVKVGGFRPTGDPFATHFGLRPLAAAGEAWPVSNGKPLLFLCQLNLTTAPFLPDILKDMALLTFLAEIEALQLGQENGANWVLRGYTSLEGLAPLDPPAGTPALKRRFECSWELVEDHPHYDDHELVVPKGFDNSDVELENAARTKIGGYATTIQSAPWWGQEEHPAKPAFCLQINSEEKLGLAFGDAGALYIARGTAEGCGDQWFLDWQCF